jgi:hypothetical protein
MIASGRKPHHPILVEPIMGTRSAVVLSFFLAACAPAGSDDAPVTAGSQFQFEDPEVTRVYERLLEVTAPDRGWERARYLEFSWAVTRGDGSSLVRSHRWDRWEGDARVEVEVDGMPRISIFNTNDPGGGRVWLGGEELTGETAAEVLAGSYRAHINDSYWLVMPYKWPDPGVVTSYLGEQTDEEGRTWEVVELSFASDIGLTPQNMYHAFINPETGRMERWHHFPEAGADPSPSDWADWRRYGPIELAENRVVDGNPRIYFPQLRVETEVPEGAFDPPTG